MFKILVTLTAIMMTSAFARPLPLKGEKSMIMSTPIINTNFDFSGQVSLGDCSGSIVKLSDRQDPRGKAMVLTNGHCLGQIDDDADAVYVNQPYSRTWRAFKDQSQSSIVRTTKIVYAIMQPHDVALVELSDTYEKLESQGIKSRVLATSMAVVGEQIFLASGLFKKVEECAIEGIIYRIKEDKWVNHNSYKYRKCNAGHGTSGSPLVSVATGLVIGVNYTGNDSGEKCTFNNPCEIDERGVVTVERGANYGDQTYKLTSCLNSSFNFDLSVEGCELPKTKP